MKFRNYDKYEVYEDGRIWSYKTNKWLKPQTDSKGYQMVCLYDNEGKGKNYKVHRVVWESVIGSKIPDGMQINHRSEIKTSNMVTNLELVTPKENANYGSRNSRISKTMTNGKTSKAVGAFKDGNLVMVFPSISECGRNGFCRVAVAACCRNCYSREGNNIFKGYEWRYI